MQPNDDHQAQLTAVEGEIRDGRYANAWAELAKLLAKEIQPATLSRALIDQAEIHWRTGKYGDAVESAQAGLDIAKSIGDETLVARAHMVLGIATKHLGLYARSLDHFFQAQRSLEERAAPRPIAMNLSNIGSVYQMLGDLDRAVEYYERSLSMNEELKNDAGISIVLGNLSEVLNARGEFGAAIVAGQRSLEIDERLGTSGRSAKHRSSIGESYFGLKDHDRALSYFRMAIELFERDGNLSDAANDYINLGRLYEDPQCSFHDLAEAERFYRRSIDLASTNSNPRAEAFAIGALASICARMERWEEAYHLGLRHGVLESDLKNAEVVRTSIRYDQELKDAEREKQRAIIRARLDATEDLLNNVLPPSIARKMLDGASVIAEKHAEVSILFADIVSFTRLAQRISAEDLVRILNTVFSRFDEIAKRFELEKIKTIGDAYMAAAGIPNKQSNHASAIAEAACEMLAVMQGYVDASTNEPIEIRIGIHCGDVVAGVIGKHKFAYDLWGDAVNTAARMESHGEVGKIHVSEQFRIALGTTQRFTLQRRGEIELRGKGQMLTYFLVDNKES